MEAELSPAFSYRQDSVRLVFKDMLACDMTIVLLPDLALPIWEFSSYQPPSGYLSITRSASGRSARDLRRQQAQGVPKACKKAGFAPTGAVCRSGTTLPVSTGASPTRRERRSAFPGSKYPAPAPCRSGSKGEAPWSPKAKSPERCGEGLEFLGDEPEKFGEGA